MVRLLAEELDCADPVAPWHTNRVRIAELGAALGIAAGAAAKIGLDVGPLSQTEVGEVSEAEGARRPPCRTSATRSEAPSLSPRRARQALMALCRRSTSARSGWQPRSTAGRWPAGEPPRPLAARSTGWRSMRAANLELAGGRRRRQARPPAVAAARLRASRTAAERSRQAAASVRDGSAPTFDAPGPGGYLGWVLSTGPELLAETGVNSNRSTARGRAGPRAAQLPRDDARALGRQRPGPRRFASSATTSGVTAVGSGLPPARGRRRDERSRAALVLRPLARGRHRDVGGANAPERIDRLVLACTSARFGEPACGSTALRS